jgi:hypothetical protein
MAKYSLAQRINKDSNVWKTVGTTFHTKWGGDPRNFLPPVDGVLRMFCKG